MTLRCLLNPWRFIQSETIFAGTRYVDNKSWSAKQRKAMSDSISEAYIDGYEGRM
ncbi:Exc2 family lipoprotein [Enterobacter asburiae]|uniref:Exc2 family lipoprotein n=1 Tax=Enterobacter asburiae TaxID=61645 RepID=UPI0012B80343